MEGQFPGPPIRSPFADGKTMPSLPWTKWFQTIPEWWPVFADNVTPTGAVDGANAIFALPNSPNPPLSLQVFVNGTLQIQGGAYTLSGSTVTFAAPPGGGSVIRVWYRY